MPLTLPKLSTTDPIKYLAEIGCPPVNPAIRSSDEGVETDPFGYFLRRRLGLVPALAYAPAFSQGIWTHHHLHNMVSDDFSLADALVETHEEIGEDGKKAGCSDETIYAAQDRQSTDKDLAAAWWAGACQIKIPQYGSIPEFLSRPWWRLLSAEEEFRTFYPQIISPIVIKPDLILYNEKQKVIWVVDLKTCSEPTDIRAATCPLEFQTFHYPFGLEWMRQTGDLFGRFPDIDHDTEIAGMIHIIMQKPTIKFGASDRPYHWHAESKRSKLSGQASGGLTLPWVVTISDDRPTCVGESEDEAIANLQEAVGTKPKKIFADDPDPDRFAIRCKDWYLAQNDSLHRETEATAVNISFTDGRFVKEEDTIAEYNRTVKLIDKYATCEPDPRCFRKRGAQLRSYGRLSPYIPFYLCPLKDWPEIIVRDKFVVHHRDPVLEVETL